MDGCRSLYVLTHRFLNNTCLTASLAASLHAWPLRRRRDRGRRWLESMSSGARAACTAWSVPLWTRRRFFPAVIVLLLLWSLLLHLGQPNRLPLFRCSSSCSRPAGLILLLLFRVDYWLAGRLCCNSMHASKQASNGGRGGNVRPSLWSSSICKPLWEVPDVAAQHRHFAATVLLRARCC
ncbi:hypothetical protein BKA81DRAFT_364973 [Phyllosticta paracitricarpa]|uniref:Uncharacterized protein n=2 Tax=Phyllosticta TaxID=121621 RepID=A0ABR1MJU8_9PEZI